ncbi:hypothetical protein DM872_19495, partial [Pseudomonas taiwanensis]|uniref:retention module-containing protein n=1 Tax=Pseudomonas taiwanensis TaxID=470150 RepID=UPI0015BA3498
MSSVIAIVKSIVGQVFAMSPEGFQRLLVEGDRLFKGDQLQTGLEGMVTLELTDGRTVDLGRDVQWSETDAVASVETQAAQPAPQTPADDVAQLQKAIEAGVDPTKELEATAAGPSAGGAGGGAAGGGHSFVMLDATGDRVDPIIGFTTGTAPLASEVLAEDDTTPTVDAAPADEPDTGLPDETLPGPDVPNGAPQAQDASLATDEDTPVTGQLGATDPEGDPLTYSPGDGPRNGTVVIDPDGSYTYTPNPNFNGTDNFTVIVEDGKGGTDTIVVTIGVNPVNDAPAAANDGPTAVTEDTPASGNVLTNDGDTDGDSLTVTQFSVGGTTYSAGQTATLSGVGTLVINTNGSYTFTPAPNYNGPVPTATYTVSDGTTTDTAELSFGNVAPVNDASVLSPDSSTMAEDSSATGNVLANDGDVDDALTVASFSVAGINGSFNAGQTATINGIGSLVINANGTYTFTPEANWNGAVPQITYITNTGSSSTLSISVTPVNDAPVAANDGPVPVTEDTPATGNVLNNDSDVEADSLTVTQFEVGGTTYSAGQTATLSGVGTLVINSDGSFTFTPAPNYNGPVPTATYAVTDGTATDTGELSFGNVIPVNDAPVASNDGPVLVTEDSPASGNVLTNDNDADGDALTVTGFSFGGTNYLAGQSGTVAGVGTLVINANGSYTFTPALNYNGPVPTATYTVSDGTATDTGELSFGNVTPVDDASALVADSNSVAEDNPAIGNVLGNDSDVDNGLTIASFSISGVTGTFTAGSSAVIAGVGTLTIAADGNYTFTPVQNWNGDVPQVTYTTNTGSSSTLDITVTPVNDASVLVADNNSVTEDNPAIGNVLGNDSDVDNTLTVTSFSVAGLTGSFTAGSNAVIAGVGTLTIAADGNYTFTPAANWNGTVPQVTYITNTGSSSTLDITATPENDSPLAANDGPVLVTEDTPATGNVLTNDSDVENDTLTVTDFTFGGSTYLAGQSGTVAGVGTLVINANGSFTFTPAPNYNGPVPTATYTVSDGNLTDTAELSFGNVSPVDDASVLIADTQTVTEDNPATGNVLTNDSDADNTLTVTSFTVAGVTGNFSAGDTATIANVGTFTLGSNGDYTFTPAANWNGSVPEVTYVTNTGSNSTLTITVTPENDGPVASNDGPIPVTEDIAATGNVLTNDNDVDNSTLTVTGFSFGGSTYLAGQSGTVAGVGTLVINANGSFTFTPAPNYNGPVPTATYTVSDGNLTDTAELSFGNVTPVDDASVMIADSNTVAEDNPATGNVLDNDGDVDNTLTVTSFSITGVPGSFTAGSNAVITGVGTLTIAANGNYTFTPAANWNGTVPQVTYTTNTGSDSTLDIIVTPEDDASALIADSNSVAEDNPAIGNVLDNDSDVDNTLTVASFTVTGVTGSFNAGDTATIANVGTFTLGSNGDYTFTPAANWNGTVPQVTYVTNTGSDSTLDIIVTPEDDASALIADSNSVAEDNPAIGNVLDNDSDVDNTLTVASF